VFPSFGRDYPSFSAHAAALCGGHLTIVDTTGIWFRLVTFNLWLNLASIFFPNLFLSLCPLFLNRRWTSQSSFFPSLLRPLPFSLVFSFYPFRNFRRPSGPTFMRFVLSGRGRFQAGSPPEQYVRFSPR